MQQIHHQWKGRPWFLSLQSCHLEASSYLIAVASSIIAVNEAFAFSAAGAIAITKCGHCYHLRLDAFYSFLKM